MLEDVCSDRQGSLSAGNEYDKRVKQNKHGGKWDYFRIGNWMADGASDDCFSSHYDGFWICARKFFKKTIDV